MFNGLAKEPQLLNCLIHGNSRSATNINGTCTAQLFDIKAGVGLR